MARTKHNTTSRGTHKERAAAFYPTRSRNASKEARHTDLENVRHELHTKRKAARAKALAAKNKAKVTAQAA